MKPGTNSISCAKSSATVSKTTSIAVVEPDASICENAVMSSSLSYTSAVFTSLVCPRSVQALHKGNTCLCGRHFFRTEAKLHTAKCTVEKKKKSIKRKTKIPVSPKRLKINVTSPPWSQRVYWSPSHRSPSGKVSSGVSLYVGVFSEHCTPEKCSQSLQWSRSFLLYRSLRNRKHL